MPDIEIKRGYVDLPDKNIRFGIRITNISGYAISDVEVILDFPDSLFKLDGERMQKLGNIPPEKTYTAEYILKPLACIHQVNIEALISYRNAKWERFRVDMRPKELHCVCPFLKGKKMLRAEFLELSSAGHTAETGLNFKGVTVERLTSFLVQTCKSRHYKVDDFSIDGGRMLYLASESIGEKAYYLLTVLVKEEEDLTQVMLRAVSDKPHGLNGFLNETVADLRHVVSAVRSAQEIGVIKKEQVINIIDKSTKIWGDVGMFKDESTSFESNDNQSEITATVDKSTKIVGDVGIYKNKSTSFVGNNNLSERTATVDKYSKIGMEEEKKRREEERRRKEREEQERLRRQKEEEERQRKAQEAEEQGRKAREEREKQRKIEAEKKERDLQEQRAEEDRLRMRNEEIMRIQREKEKERIGLENEKQSSGGKWVFGMIIIFAVLALGWYGTQDSSSTAISTPQKTNPYVTTTPVAVDTSSSNQKTITNSIGMGFVLIQAGEFDMGSPSNEVGRDDNEGPVHRVKISNAFYMGKYEVTQKQWRDVMGSSPSNFKGDNLPVESVSWNDIQEFIKNLNEKEGGGKYRLPTEAEWEYSARAGTTTKYSFGDEESKLGDYSWYDANSGSKTHDVGQKKPNPWGLYDMHGNVYEWVQDNLHGDYNGAPTDGSSWEIGVSSLRVIRGGGWLFNAGGCRSAIRRSYDPSLRNNYFLGFRLLMSIPTSITFPKSNTFNVSYVKINDSYIQINVKNIGKESVFNVSFNIDNVQGQGFLIIRDNNSNNPILIGNINPGDYSSAIVNIKKISGKGNNIIIRIDYKVDKIWMPQTTVLSMIVDDY